MEFWRFGESTLQNANQNVHIYTSMYEFAHLEAFIDYLHTTVHIATLHHAGNGFIFFELVSAESKVKQNVCVYRIECISSV